MDIDAEQVLNFLPQQMSIMDARGRLLFANQAWRQGDRDALDLPEEAEIERPVWGGMATVLADAAQALLSGAATHYETEYVHPSRQLRWLVRALPIVADGQHCLFVLRVQAGSGYPAGNAAAEPSLAQVLSAQQAQELEGLLRLSGRPTAAVTAQAFGLVPFRLTRPDIFELLATQYANLLEQAIERRVYKVEHDISAGLRDIANRLGRHRAGPRDVIELHTQALTQSVKTAGGASARLYMQEGHLMSLELMGCSFDPVVVRQFLRLLDEDSSAE